MKDNIYQIGIVGFGGMGNWHYEFISGRSDWHGQELHSKFAQRLAVKGVYDIAPERMDYAQKLGLQTYGSCKAMFSDPEVDIVLCATPNDSHKSIGIAALRAGKHLVCEKPVAMNSKEAAEIQQAAEQSQHLFTVHQNRRWDADFRTVKKIYDENHLGEIYHIESRVHGSRGIPGDWRNEAQYGGGMMLDWGVHIIDQMLFMIPEKITQVFCQMNNVINYEVDDNFRLTLFFASGKTALLEVGTSNFIGLPRWYVLGINGSAVIFDWDLKGQMALVKDWGQNNVIPIQAGQGLTKTMAPRTDETISEQALPSLQEDGHHVSEFYCNLLDNIENKASKLLVSFDQVQRCMQLIEAAFESSQRCQAVAFED